MGTGGVRQRAEGLPGGGWFHRGHEWSRGDGVSERAEGRVLRRFGGAAAVAALIAGFTVGFAPAGSASAAGVGVGENAAARDAVVELVGERPEVAGVPGDFAVGAGYRPVVSQGLLVDPDGDCSAPIPLPAEFENPCKAHDLGYDLLRYAERHGQPLGPWARQRIDAALEQNLHSACATRPDAWDRTGCHALATIAATAVDLNSRRQHYAAPMPEYLFGAQLSGSNPLSQLLWLGPAALLLLAVAALLGRRATLRRIS
ncbi:hypothetical protein ACFYTQ_00245 [Nocardia sp. NPDC004068]|uniref:hypothetical protein n=1 Tax=Nocardia sp. NPDC004068 TaxID=3364303 RepID=UPI00368EEEB9